MWDLNSNIIDKKIFTLKTVLVIIVVIIIIERFIFILIRIINKAIHSKTIYNNKQTLNSDSARQEAKEYIYLYLYNINIRIVTLSCIFAN